MRLAKYLAHAGVASRRGATEIVRSGRVRVDGAVELDPAREIEAQTIELDGVALAGPEELVVYALNKPAGVVSTARDGHGRRTVVELIAQESRRLYPVGRLDAQTTGLILLTNDGELANLLTHPRYEVAKTYRATVAGGPVVPQALDALRSGIELDDGRTAPARARLLAPGVIELELREGRKRQVRRMCEAIGHPVTALERVRFGSLELGSLAPGAHRRLSDAELEALRQAPRNR
ncbi:MAG: pseudouridine synthase [Solirubrobacteraceae bacterium]|jgi:23S rRNA pseudouridine2605 synthase